MSKPRDHRLGPLVRDVAQFQFKLLLDALRDVVLSPLALIAGALDLLLLRAQPPRFFRTVMRAGRRSEEWIDLWAALARDRYGVEPERVDAMIAHVEAVLRDPRTGSRKARVLRRWLERQWRHARAVPPAGAAPASGSPHGNALEPQSPPTRPHAPATPPPEPPKAAPRTEWPDC